MAVFVIGAGGGWYGHIAVDLLAETKTPNRCEAVREAYAVADGDAVDAQNAVDYRADDLQRMALRIVVNDPDCFEPTTVASAQVELDGME